MPEIPLHNRKGAVVAVAIVDEEDYPVLSRLSWHLMSGYPHHSISRAAGGPVVIAMHRFIINPKAGTYVDHVNGDPLDNRRCNLRTCSRMQNAWNKVRKGVTLDRRSGLWLARIQHNKVKETIGWYKTRWAAMCAYRRRAKELRGEWYRVA